MVDWYITLMAWTHLVYLAVAAGITVYVGRNLQKHGRVFATNADDTHGDIVDAFTHLLKVGFYLLSFSAVNLTLQYGRIASNAQTAIEVISTKIGVVLLVLGLLHFAMTIVLANVRRQNRKEQPAPEPSLDSFNRDRKRQTI